MKNKILFLSLFFSTQLAVYAQNTYSINGTEYYYGEKYTTTGHPKVKRSQKAKSKFLKSINLKSIPDGHEIDHIIPLSQGGSDTPSNMQLLTEKSHARKTASERRKVAKKKYPNTSRSRSTTSSSYNNSNNKSNSRIIQTGKRGGKYYINKNGNKTYIKK